MYAHGPIAQISVRAQWLSADLLAVGGTWPVDRHQDL